MKTTTTVVIGLWLDSTGGDHVWIVSRDGMVSRGEAETTKTIDTYPAGDYSVALETAERLAKKNGICVIETQPIKGTDCVQQVCIYQPEGAVNPLA